MFTALVLAIVFLPMLLEARRAALNERAQMARGGVEARGDVYAPMRVAYPGAFLLMIIESAVRGSPRPSIIALGAVVFAAGKALKWWAIVTLGPAWTFRVIMVPNASLVATGPYAVLRHPNYVGVVGELVGTALMTGAVFSGPIATLGFGALMLARIRVEERALGPSNP